MTSPTQFSRDDRINTGKRQLNRKSRRGRLDRDESYTLADFWRLIGGKLDELNGNADTLRIEKEFRLPSADVALQKKLTALKRHVERIDAVADFLTRNQKVAEQTTLKRMSTGTGLYFEEKGYIRPVATGPVCLQLEKHIEDWDIEDSGPPRIICKDVRFFSPEQLNDVLKKIGVDLNNPDADEYEDGDEREGE